MSHEVETMAWAVEKPWHNLGTEVEKDISLPKMLVQAGIDWTVSKQKLKVDRDGKEYDVKDHYALVRDSDNSVLDVVGDRYEPIQNAEAFEFFREFLDAGNATLETAGSLRKGKIVWGLANLHNSFSIGHDRVNNYLLVTAPHERGKGMSIMNTSIRVVCNNTLSVAHAQNKEKFRMPHLSKFDEKMIKVAKDTLGLAKEEFNIFGEVVKKMASQKVDDEVANRIFAELVVPKKQREDFDYLNHKQLEEEGNKKLKLLLHSYKHGAGQNLESAKGTVWGIVNAVTYMTDHLLGRNDDSRMFNSWFGTSATLKKRVFNEALALVE